MTKKMNLIFVALFFSMLLSCSSHKGLIIESASNYYINNPDYASVTVIRIAQSFGGPMIVGLHLDGDLIAHMQTGNYTKFFIKPGEHYIGIVRKFLGGEDEYEFISFKTEPGMKYFYQYSMTPERGILKQITEKEVEELLREDDYYSLNSAI